MSLHLGVMLHVQTSSWVFRVLQWLAVCRGRLLMEDLLPRLRRCVLLLGPHWQAMHLLLGDRVLEAVRLHLLHKMALQCDALL